MKKGDWYLIAFCEAGQEIRTFKCERIMAVKVKPSAEFFEVPVDFSLENHWMKQEAAFEQLCREKEYYPVVIRTNEAQAGIVEPATLRQFVKEEISRLQRIYV
ncbi:UNVERIFIED_CONTAM: putative DNA-binding transcriptional regulator YafY [Paenibacillus sp. PvR008]